MPVKNKRFLKRNEPSVTDDLLSTTVLLRGHKTSNEVKQCLRDLTRLKSPHAAFLSQKHAFLPFESPDDLAKLVHAKSAKTFVLGNHTKKRPHNLVFGRLFNGEVYDLIEFGLSGYVSLREIGGSVNLPEEAEHVVVFRGFDDVSENYPMLKQHSKLAQEMLLDFFRARRAPSALDLASIAGVVCACVIDGKISLRFYETSFAKPEEEASDDEDDSDVETEFDLDKFVSGRDKIDSSKKPPKIELFETGPVFDLTIRRVQIADEVAKREAMRISHETERSLSSKTQAQAAKRQKKNIERTATEGLKGRLRLEHQDLSKIVPDNRARKVRKKAARRAADAE